MQKIFLFVVGVFLFFGIASDVNAQSACTAPSGGAGRCVTGGCTGGNVPLSGGTGCSPTQTCCVAASGTTSSGSSSVQIPNPLRYSSVETFVSSVMVTIQGIVAVLAVLAIVIGGVLYVISAGNSTLMGQAKNAITGALIGLAIVLAAPSFLKEIYNILGANETPPGEVARALSLTQIAMNVLNFLLSIIGILGVIMMVIGGLIYLTSAGDSKRIDTGKNMVKYSMVGVAIALASLILIQTVESIFRF